MSSVSASVSLYDQIQTAVSVLRRVPALANFTPEYGIVLGTGLSNLADHIEAVATVPYSEIPAFAAPTVEGHVGKLIFGMLSGRRVVAMAGRFHHYEGYTMREVTFPVRVMQALGATSLIVSNASGSVNPAFGAGDIVLLRDHINAMPENPLRGPNDERLGARFPDMLATYRRDWNAALLRAAAAEGIRAHEGVYYALAGPNLETPAEYEMIHRLGADIIGMSTVPEVLVARHGGMSVLALSVVANVSYPPEAIRETTLEEVLATVRAAEPAATKLVAWFLSQGL